MDVRGKGKGHAVPARNSCVRATACGRLHVGDCVWETACGRLGRSHPILRGLPPFIITATVIAGDDHAGNDHGTDRPDHEWLLVRARAT